MYAQLDVVFYSISPWPAGYNNYEVPAISVTTALEILYPSSLSKDLSLNQVSTTIKAVFLRTFSQHTEADYAGIILSIISDSKCSGIS